MAYATRTNLENLFGLSNVTKWADIEGDGVAATITARITLALDNADTEINDRLRDGRYAIPIVSNPLPLGLVDTAARLAGVWLYESRGVVDMDLDTGRPIHKLQWHAKRAENWIKKVKTGVLKLSEATTVSFPEIVTHVLSN